jgi:sugar-specific transcriptional regulator TrmB
MFGGSVTMKEKLTPEEILNAICIAAPYYQKVIPLDCMIGVTDTKKFIEYIPGKEMKLGEEGALVGMELPDGDAITQAVHTGKTEMITVPEEAFGIGISFRATGTPIKDSDGNIIGGLGLGINLHSQDILNNAISIVAASSEDILITTTNLSQTSQQLAQQLMAVRDSGAKVLNNVNKTDEILRFINSISVNSNLLGLNASIEAARAGDIGKGFAVVAEEIRKMAVNSSDAIKKIKEIISAIKDETIIMDKEVSETSSLGSHQAEATEKITAAIDQLNLAASNLRNISHII